MKNVIFDLDGVLVDMVEAHYVCFREAVYQLTNHWVDHFYHAKYLNGLPTKKKIEFLIENGKFKNADRLRICALKQALTIDYINENLKFDREKYTTIRMLKENGFQIGCVTNSIRLTTDLMLKNIGIINLFDAIVTNEDIKDPKPSPDGYEKCIKILNASPDNTIIVEDSPVGVQAAKATKCKVLVVKNPKRVTYKNILKGYYASSESEACTPECQNA